MHHTAKTLKKSIYKLTIISSMIVLMSCSIIMAILVKTFNYRLAYAQDFSVCYVAETLLFFPYHDLSCNFSSICFILGGFIYSQKKVLLKQSVFFA